MSTTSQTRYKLAVLVSGSGTILQAMIEHGVEICLVLADRPCRGIEIAQEAGIDALVINRKDFGWSAKDPWDARTHFNRDDFSKAVATALDEHLVTLVALSGFMTILSRPFFELYAGHVINTHPALLPSFPGAHGVRDALEFGVKVTGCTLHLATETVDYGPILEQRAIEIPDQGSMTFADWEDTVQELIKTQERKLYPSVLKEILNGSRDLPELTDRYR